MRTRAALLTLGVACLLGGCARGPTCSSDEDCTSGVCDPGLGVCVRACDPISGYGCQDAGGPEPHYGCRFRSSEDFVGVCREVGNAGELDPCDTQIDCAGSLICASGRCLRLCRVGDEPCGRGAICTPIGGPVPEGVGACVP